MQLIIGSMTRVKILFLLIMVLENIKYELDKTVWSDIGGWNNSNLERTRYDKS